jgi:hypothetical protein
MTTTEPDDPATDPISEPMSMSMSDFEALPPARRPKSAQRTAIEAMRPGEALSLSHEGLAHKGRNCSYNTLLSAEIPRTTHHRYSIRHLPDGRVAVACYEREEEIC